MVVQSDTEGDEVMEEINEIDFIPNLSQPNNCDQLPRMHQLDEVDTIVSNNELAVQTDQMDFMHREVQTDCLIITRDQATQTEQDQQNIQNALKDSNDCSLQTPPYSPSSSIGSHDLKIPPTTIENNREEWNNDYNLDFSREGKLLFWLHYFEFHGS